MCAKLIAFKKRCKPILTVGLMLFLFGCTETIYFYPPDKSQCITVITKKWTAHRYIIAGKHHTVPEKNFVKLDVESGDSYRSALYFCWKSGKYEWEAAVDYASVIESTLDTTAFNFMIEFPTNDRGIPTAIKFTKEGCDVFSFDLKRLMSEEGGTIVEYE